MPKLLNSLKKITKWFDNQDIPYMVFGGIANAIYGNPRQTYDIDIKIFVEKAEIENFAKNIQDVAKILTANPLDFISDTNVLPVEINGVKVDIVLAILPFEKKAIERSQKVTYQNVNMKVCTIEDLIIQKAVSERTKDWNDIKTTIKLNKDRIDWDYLIKNCKEISDFLSRSEILNKIKRYKNES